MPFDIAPVRTDDAKTMVRRIAREEALFAGASSGANVVAVISGRAAGAGGQGGTLMADSNKYLSTDVYKNR